MIFAHLLHAASTLPTDASALESSISALESEIKTLESSSAPWEHLLPWFTAIVALGVAMELWVIRHERRDDMEAWAVAYFLGTARLPGRPSKAKSVIEVASVLLITLGIVGELGIGIKIASINGALRGKSAQLRSKSDQLLALVTLQAGDARDSAKTAHDEVDVVGKEADEIQKRLDGASRQLSEVEVRVRVQGPRWRILAENKATFVQDLKALSGARLTVIICGSAISPIEQHITEQRLLELLGKGEIGAGWNTGYDSWSECPNTTSNGLEITLNSIASEDLKKAATALCDELNSLSIVTSLDVLPIQRGQFMANVFGVDSPWARAVRDPSTIFLLVAPNAMVNNAKPAKRSTKNK